MVRGGSDPKSLVPALRTVQVGFRITQDDAHLLSRLARDARVGHLTLARLIVERYLAERRSESNKRGARRA
jgi:hypothetical protein